MAFVSGFFHLTMLSKFIHFIICTFSLIYGWIISHGKDIPYFVSWFISLGAFERIILLWMFMYKFLCGRIVSLRDIPMSEIARSYGNSKFINPLDKLPDHLTKQLYHFKFLPAMWGFQLLHSLTNTWFYLVFVLSLSLSIAILVVLKLYLIVLFFFF